MPGPQVITLATAPNLVTSFAAGSNTNTYSGNVGMQFTSQRSLSVTSLGCRMATGNTSGVVSISTGAGAVIASATVSFSGGTVGNFYYTAVTPVTLAAGTIYQLTLAVTNGGPMWAGGGAIAVNAALGTSVYQIYGNNLGAMNQQTAGYCDAGVDLIFNPTLIEQNGCNGWPNTNIAITLPTAPTVGNLLIGMAVAPGITPNSYWTRFAQSGNIDFFYRYVQSGDAALLTSFYSTTPSGGSSGTVWEISGAAPTWSAALDKYQGTTGTGTSLTTSTIVTAAANELALLFSGFTSNYQYSGVPVPASPWIKDTFINSQGANGASAHQSLSAAGASVAATVTFPSTTLSDGVGIILLAIGATLSKQSFMGSGPF